MQRRLTDFFNLSDYDSSICTGKLTMLNVSTLKTPINRKRKLKTDNNKYQQTVIDAGQKQIGLQHCIKCGMVYNIDEKIDVEQHEAYHNRFKNVKYFQVTITQIEFWKNNLYWETVDCPLKGILFWLSGSSSVSLRKKIEEIIRNFINEEIGYCSDLPIWDLERKRQALVFVAYLTKKNKSPFIGGILLVDNVKTATLMPQKKHFRGQFLSVNRIWTHTQIRRKKIATFLLDSACRLLVKNKDTPLPRTRIAFNDPTDAGVNLARSYLGDKKNHCYIIYLSHPELYMVSNTNNLFNSEPIEKKKKYENNDENQEKNTITEEQIENKENIASKSISELESDEEEL